MKHFGFSEFQFPFYFTIYLFAFLLGNLLMSRLVRYVDPSYILRVAALVQMLSLAVIFGSSLTCLLLA